MLLLLLLGQLGAIWDREWHYFIGRDSFWIPPHILIYSGVAGAGLCALVVVLSDTVRYYRRAPDVDARSTVRFLGLFHAPFGFFVAGIGILVSMTAAPLDNWWHEMYGIDVVMWAPFHMMGITGAIIGNIGMIYIFASEAAVARASAGSHTENSFQNPVGRARAERSGPPPGQPGRGFAMHSKYVGLSGLEWGELFLIAGFLNFIFIGFLQFPIATIGSLRLPTSDLPLAAGGSFALIAAVRSTQLPGAALLTLGLLAIQTVLDQAFLPWGLSTGASSLGLSYRVSQRPIFNLADALLPLVFLASALLIYAATQRMGQASWVLRCRARDMWLLGCLAGLFPALIAPCLLLHSLNLPDVFLEQSDLAIPPDLKLQAMLIALPVILACGALGAMAGALFGDVWRWSKR